MARQEVFMSEYVIVTDSSADLPAKLVEEMGIEVLPLSFKIGRASCRERV